VHRAHAAHFERLSQHGFRNNFVAGKQIQQPVIFEIWAAPGRAESAQTRSEALRARFSSERFPGFPGAAQLTKMTDFFKKTKNQGERVRVHVGGTNHTANLLHVLHAQRPSACETSHGEYIQA
jgi:hypothetical protein